ncbi:hypothetical protein [Dactylosporangium matsuzakiense]|uniref:SPFH domain/Band 7 family protein n=1 Tax=Dactylosporangium matsuzakiense TaxID=53360 RepID=A0A9W6KLJ8_9ACTN|nr:hypothetical protein [Dactylosporangium matsuzakiense]UWZ43149.1 hypothetical protein Dmats_37520 [Dactylosporangium matsuzakiense]GLL02764.1 hypothetical protein GCM10017581_045060 [Dactylosporangium matsuzakiense]
MGLILSETKLQRFRLGRPSPARTGVTIVVQTAGGQTTVMHGQRTAGEALFAPHSMQYEVDTSDQRSRIELAVKTREEAFAFQVVVDVVWRVEDAEEVVRRRMDDGAAVISTVVRDRLKELGRQFSVQQTVEFERRIRGEFADARSRVGCLRIVLVTPDVTLDAAGTAQLAEVRAAQGQTAVIQANHTNEVLRQRNADELAAIARQHEVERERISRQYETENQQRAEAARRDTLQFEEERARREAEHRKRLEIEEANFQAELELKTAQRRAELAAWEADSNLERRLREAKEQAALDRERTDYEITNQRQADRERLELEERRTALFQRAIDHGDPDMLAVHLGMHPEDAKDFIMALAASKTATAERQAELLNAMIERKLIIPADVEDVGPDLLRAVAGMPLPRFPEADTRSPLSATAEDARATGTGDV